MELRVKLDKASVRRLGHFLLGSRRAATPVSCAPIIGGVFDSAPLVWVNSDGSPHARERISPATSDMENTSVAAAGA